MSGTIVVLTPNGRRQSVKVTPNTTLLQVLEEACQKQGFQAELYNLKHHRKVLDVTLTVRFAGLPNNCLLELIEAETARTEKSVTVGVQLEDGKRLMDDFNTSATVEQVLKRLCPSEINENTVVIYMRNEIYGEELNVKNLKDLGITSGRAMLRLMHSSAESEDMKRKQPLFVKKDVFSILRMEKRKQTDGQKIKSQPRVTQEENTTSTKTKDDFIFLGERNAMLFSFETAQAVSSDDLPDDFFELSITDVKKLFRDIKQRRIDLESGNLMTSAMRELEANKKQLRALNQYKKAVIRIKFPDRFVLQGVFKPSETVRDVEEFVREYVADKSLQFYLFTTPPKTILENSMNLLEAECVPGALLHFGCDDKRENYLRSDILDKVVSTTSAATAASQARTENVRVPRVADDDDMDISEYLTPETNAAPASISSDSMDYEPRVAPPPTEKLPKWFKPSK
ncbi:tether containing UBX domain for GLUT4 isoform X2 [Atheta coriaria]|uniref:tether containing UBX domain for GLUT4 isoform X2 n=1 Tax=Dalotia coriaria TaxID=877792 RepID=UPI0031F3DF20